MTVLQVGLLMRLSALFLPVARQAADTDRGRTRLLRQAQDCNHRAYIRFV